MSRSRAATEMVLAALLFGLMAWTAKHATRSLGGAQTAFVRFAIGAAAVAAQSAARHAPLRVVRWDFLFLRGVFGGVAVLLYFLSIAHLPVGTATLLNYSSPVFAAIFSAIFLRERLPLLNILAMLVAGAGVTLVVVGQGKSLGGAYGWQLIALGSAFLSGAAVTSIRAARRTDGPWEIFGAFCIVGMLCTVPVAIAEWRTPSLTSWLLLLAVGLLAVVAPGAHDRRPRQDRSADRRYHRSIDRGNYPFPGRRSRRRCLFQPLRPGLRPHPTRRYGRSDREQPYIPNAQDLGQKTCKHPHIDAVARPASTPVRCGTGLASPTGEC